MAVEMSSFPGVYVAKSVDGPYWKVGTSKDVIARVASLNHGSPFEIQSVFFIPEQRNRFSLEAAILASVAPWRARGEWFKLERQWDHDGPFIETVIAAAEGFFGGPFKISPGRLWALALDLRARYAACHPVGLAP